MAGDSLAVRMQRARVVSPVATKDQDRLRTTSFTNENEKYVDAIRAGGGGQSRRTSQIYSIKSMIYKGEWQGTLKIKTMKQVRQHLV